MNDTTAKRVMVLGGYGLAGEAVVRDLIEKTEFTVIACGRNPDKIERLSKGIQHPKLSFRVLDVTDADGLREACGEVDLVINCVGPFALTGIQTARAVLEAGTPYVDIANEQVHFRRLTELDALARERGVCLLTAAGASLGLAYSIGYIKALLAALAALPGSPGTAGSD